MVRTDIHLSRGSLILASMMMVSLIFAQNGNVGIGTTNPDTTLHVVGKMKIDDGSQKQGRLLTSDSAGMATWSQLSANSLLPALPMATLESCLDLSGTLQIGPNPNEVDVVDDYAYVIDRTTEDLKIIDISNPMKPILVDSVGIGGTPIDIRVLDGYAYVVDVDDNDLKVIDVADPANPSVSGSLAFDFSPEAVDVQDNYAYVVGNAIGADTLKVIDISNPALPMAVGDLAIGTDVQSVSVSGSYAYVVDSGTDDLRVIDISSPGSPSQVGSLPVGPYPDGVVVRGMYAYVLESTLNTLRVVDVSNPAMPLQVGSVFTGTLAQGETEMRIGQEFICVVDVFSDRLRVIDVREKTSPVLVDSIPLDATPIGLAVDGNFAYVVDHGSQDLKVIQLFCLPTVGVDPISGEVFESPAVSWQRNGGDLYNLNPAGIGIGTSEPAAKLHIAGDLKITDGTESDGYVLTSDSMGLASWQLLRAQSLLKTPVSKEDLCLYVAATKSLGSDPRKIQVQGQYAYVLDQSLDSMYVLDISTPTHPVLVGQVEVGGPPYGLFVNGDYAYTVSLLEGLEVIDITDPSNPAVVGSEGLGILFPTPADVFVLGDYAYVIDDGAADNFKVIDISNPLNPSTDGSTSLGDPTAVYVQGSYAYVVDDGTNELRIIDVSNPASPSEAGSEPIGTSPKDVVVEGDYAYVIDSGSDDLKVIDVSSSAFPSVVATLPMGALPSALVVDGSDAYVLEEISNELTVIDISDPAVPFVRADIAIGFAPVSFDVADNYAFTVDYVNDEVSVINLICEPNIYVDPISGDLVGGEPSAWQWSGANISNLNGGNVGIGTTTPSENLVVGDDFGTDLDGTRLTISEATGTSGLNVGENIDNRAWILWNRFDNLLELGTRALGVQYANSLVLRDGKIGVGESDPETTMHIAGGNWNVAGTEGDFKIGSSTHRLAMGVAVDGGGAGDARIFVKGGLNRLTLGAGSTDVLSVRSNGRVGIGTKSPAEKLHVSGGDQLLDRGSSSSGLTRSVTIGGARSTLGSAFARLDFMNYDDGTDGFGGTSVDYVGARISSENTGRNDDGDLRFYTANGGVITDDSPDMPQMIIDEDGNVGIGVASPSYRLEVSGSIYATDNGDIYTGISNGVINAGGGVLNANVNVIGDAASPSVAAGDEDLYVQDVLEVGNNAYKPGGGSWATISDSRLKRDISTYTDGLAQILQINPVTFHYNDRVTLYDGGREYVGIIAQEMQEVAPYTIKLTPLGQLVQEDAEGNETIIDPGEEYYTFDGSALVYMLINAVKEQQAIIDAQGAQLAELSDLQAKLKTMEERMAKYESVLFEESSR